MLIRGIGRSIDVDLLFRRCRTAQRRVSLGESPKSLYDSVVSLGVAHHPCPEGISVGRFVFNEQQTFGLHLHIFGVHEGHECKHFFKWI